MQTYNTRAAQLMSEGGELPEGEAVKLLAAALRAAYERGRRDERRWLGKEAGVSARAIQARLLRAAKILEGSDPTAASALRDYGNRITNEWGYRP